MLEFRVFKRLIVLCGFLFIFVARGLGKNFKVNTLTHPPNVNGYPTFSILNIGNWGFWANWEGMTAHDPYTGGGGGYFPKDKAPVIYEDGILWGAYLRDPVSGKAISDTPRVGGIHYRVGTMPGWIQENGHPVDPENPRVRIYRIRSDWREMTKQQLRVEASYLYNVSTERVTNEMLNAVQEQYQTDWREWPVDLGAPYVDVNGNGTYDPVLDSLGCPDETKGDYPGIAEANQVIWMVANDLNETKTLNLSGSKPIGLEVHLTLWTYKGSMNRLGNVVFKRIEILNKSGFQLDSMFIAMFSDPDVGDYRDDLVGCDSTRSLGFAYNGSDNDAEFLKYGLKPPAVVYDLLQGPMVKSENPQDTAIFNFKHISGYKNLPMTSFGYTTAGGVVSDPPLGIIDFTLLWYNLMNGYVATTDLKNPTPYLIQSGPRKGETTKFPLYGNPVVDPNAQFGDIDGQGGNMSPGDRRMNLNSGPFTMQPGDKQDILVAIIGGLGKDRLNSLQNAFETDQAVKNAYKSLFKNMPGPPKAPLVRATPLDDKIILNWGFDTQRIKETEDEKHGGYIFEGYTVYQLPDSTTPLTDERVKRLATFDRIDGITDIYATFLSPRYHNKPIFAPVQYGTDSGIRHYFMVQWDSIKNRPLYRGSTYYFAVTAYNYNPYDSEYPTIESQPRFVKVTLQGPKPGERFLAQPEDTVQVEKEGEGDVQCFVKVVDPAELTGHRYEIYFVQDQDTLSPTYGQMVWNLKDLTENKLVLSKQKLPVIKADKGETDQAAPIVDGLLVSVFLTKTDKLKAIVEVANANGPLPESDWDGAGAPYHGNNVWHSLSAPSDVNRFYISAGGASGNIERLERSIANAHSHDFELRFTQSGGIYCWWYDADTIATVPFEMWDVGVSTYDDNSDDVRCLTGGYSGGGTVGAFDFSISDPYFGFPATDWIYARVPIDDQGTYEAFYNDVTSNAFTYRWWKHSKEVLAHIIICDFSGARTLPQTGTVIRFITTKGPQADTKFYFTAPSKIENDKELAKRDVEKVNVFPNPYYGASEMEPDRFTHFVTFNHLPNHAIIRIFTLNGVQVRKLEKNDDSQFLRWDLRNKSGLPIASGLYIIRVEMPELNKTKVLKLLVVGTEEVPRVF